METVRVIWQEAAGGGCRQALASPALYDRLGRELLLVKKPSHGGVEKDSDGGDLLVQLVPFDGLQEEGEAMVVQWEGTGEYSAGDTAVDTVGRNEAALEEVLVASMDDGSFTHSQREEEEFKWHMAMGDLGRVVGEGDIVRLPNGHSYRVLHCSPYRQGLIPAIDGGPDGTYGLLPAAKVVVVPPMDSGTPLVTQREASQRGSAGRSSLGITGFHSLLFPQSLSSGDLSASVGALPEVRAEIALLEHPIAAGRLEEESDNDINRRAYAAVAVMRALCICSGSWARVSAGEREHLLRLYPFPAESKTAKECGDRLLISASPSAFHSLALERYHTNTDKLFVTLCVAPVDESKQGTAGEVPCPLAKSVTLAKVASYHSYGHISAEDISAFFSVPRVVSEGEIILIWIRKLGLVEESRFKLAAKQSGSGEGGSEVQEMYDELVKAEALLYGERQGSIEKQPVFYKVVSLEVEGKSGERAAGVGGGQQSGFVDVKKTKVVEQGGVLHSRIPRGIVEFSNDCLPLAPVGQEAVFQSLCEALSPLVGEGCQRSLRNEVYCSFLIHGSHGSGKRLLVKRLCSNFGLHLLDVDCYDVVDAIDSRTVASLEAVFDDAFSLRPAVLLLRNVSVLEKAATQQQRESLMASAFRSGVTALNERVRREVLSAASSDARSLPPTVTVIATETKVDDLSGNLRSCFSHEARLESPDEQQRYAVLQQFLESRPLSGCASATNEVAVTGGSRVFSRSIAMQTAGCTAGDLQALAALSRANCLSKKRKTAMGDRRMTEETLRKLGASLTGSDLEPAFERIQTAQAEELGAPKVPNVRWDDVGGLADAKKDIVDTIQLPLSHPHLFADGLRLRSGVLLYGPPGTGKTLLAKAVATECSLNFLSVKGPELINMYVGESEKNIRDVFQRARNARPCVIFFDELDSLAPNRGHGSDSGGVMDRVVSQLLAELDGLQKASSVFVIGATNRPDLLDPALLRPGRLDKLLYLGVCRTVEAQLPVLRALTRKFDLHADLRLEEVAKECPLTFTGADFYALCTDALMAAMKERVALVDAVAARVTAAEALGDHQRTAAEKEILSLVEKEPLLVEKRHFLGALPGITPSVSEKELIRYEEIRKKYS